MLLKNSYNKSIYIIREARTRFTNLALMWGGGKDSTLMLYLTKEALYNNLPSIIFLDTTFAFRETKEYIRIISKLWNFNLIYFQNREALSKGINPWNYSKIECCTKLKTDALNQCIQKYNFDGLMFGIRWDEHPIRGKEKYFSSRDVPCHMRVHPILHWSEEDVWRFIKKYNIPYNPLYDRIINDKKYKSIGCYPCTKPISQEEYLELGERGGRSLDKEKIMERLRSLGYM